MGKKKAPNPKTSQPSKDSARRLRTAMTLVRSSEPWKEAVEQFADWDRATSISELVDRAIISYARERGYDKPIPKR